MPTEVVMPKLGMTMVEGTVKEWLVPDGAAVTAGQPIFRLTTEKIDFEVEAETEGMLRHAVPAGTVVPTGALVAYLLAPGEAPPVAAMAAGAGAGTAAPVSVSASHPAGEAASGAVAAEGWVRASPAARRLARELGVDLALVPSGAGGMVHEAEVRAFHEQRGRGAARAPAQPAEVRASPLARRLAEQHGIDLRSVRGSGPGGRIVQEDVERLVAAGAPASAPSPLPASCSREAGGGWGRGETIPFAGMRRTIAERMHAALQEMAQLTITTEADVTELVRLRNQLVEEWQRDGVRPGYTDLVVKAAAKALREHPRVNASLDGDVIQMHEQVNIGIAVALDDGLIVPVIQDAGRLPLKRLARTAAALAERARGGKLTFDDIAGGTFSVTSLGMYEVDTFTPIVNPPQVAILGVGRVREAVALVGREAVARQVMALSLSFDHRLLDGAPAAEFLRRVKHLLERPYLLLVEEE